IVFSAIREHAASIQQYCCAKTPTGRAVLCPRRWTPLRRFMAARKTHAQASKFIRDGRPGPKRLLGGGRRGLRLRIQRPRFKQISATPLMEKRFSKIPMGTFAPWSSTGTFDLAMRKRVLFSTPRVRIFAHFEPKAVSSCNIMAGAIRPYLRVVPWDT